MNQIGYGILIGYLVIINVVAFIVMGVDKRKAKKHKWRIQEKTLFGLVLVGGSIGGILGMQIFRHKTKHMSFIIGFPLVLIIQMLVGLWLFLN